MVAWAVAKSGAVSCVGADATGEPKSACRREIHSVAAAAPRARVIQRARRKRGGSEGVGAWRLTVVAFTVGVPCVAPGSGRCSGRGGGEAVWDGGDADVVAGVEMELSPRFSRGRGKSWRVSASEGSGARSSAEGGGAAVVVGRGEGAVGAGSGVGFAGAAGVIDAGARGVSARDSAAERAGPGGGGGGMEIDLRPTHGRGVEDRGRTLGRLSGGLDGGLDGGGGLDGDTEGGVDGG